MATTTERVLAAVVLMTVRFVYCSAQDGGCSPPADILMTGDDKLGNNVPTILSNTVAANYLRPKFGGQGTDWWTVYSETQVRDHGLWCQVLPTQNPTDVADIGDWYYPLGDPPDSFTLVPTTSSSSVPYQSLKCTDQIGLLRINNITNNQGIVKCNTTLTPPRTTNYLVVYSDDVYNSYSGPTVDPSMKLSLLTPKEAVSNLDFTLSFTVSNGGPSRLRCVDGNNVNLFSDVASRGPFVSALSREVIRSHYINSSYPDMTRVSITRTGQPRIAATYTCTVYVEGRINPANRLAYNFRQMGNGVSTASITVAGSPTNAMVTRTGFNSVSVSWTAPSTPPAIYEVFYQSQVSGMNSTTLSGGNTELTLTGLSLESYSIFVVGSGADGDLVLPSVRSNTVTVMIDIPQLPSVPTLVPSSTSIMVSWTPTQFTPINYRVGYSCQLICGSSSLQQTDTVSGSLTEHTITSIAPGSTCTVSVIAVFGSSIISNTVTSSTNTTSAAPTGAPGGLTSTLVESRSLSVVWGTVPCPHQRGPITGYRLRYSNGTSIVNTTGEESRQHVLTGLTPFISYSLEVAAVNDGGTGPYNTTLTVETLQDVPGPVSNLSVAPGVVEVNISWNPPSERNGIIVVYELAFSVGGTILNNTNTSDTQYTLRDLPPRSIIITIVWAYTAIGPGDFSNIDTTTMDVPTINVVSANPVNSTAVRVTWTPLNLPVVDHYTVHYSSIVNGGSGRRKRQSNSGSVTFPASVSSGVVSGLLEEEQYQFHVTVTLSVGGVLHTSLPGPSVNALTVSSTSLRAGLSFTTNLLLFTTYLPLPSTSYLSSCLSSIPSSSPQSCQSQSVLGYSTALGVVSVLLVISLVGNLTTVIVCVLVRKTRHSPADTKKRVPENTCALYDMPTLPTKEELDDIETSPNKAYGTTHHRVTTPTDECQYEDVNMCTS